MRNNLFISLTKYKILMFTIVLILASYTLLCIDINVLPNQSIQDAIGQCTGTDIYNIFILHNDTVVIHTENIEIINKECTINLYAGNDSIVSDSDLNKVIIDGSSNGSCLAIIDCINVSINGLILTNGNGYNYIFPNTSPAVTTKRGGGIYTKQVANLVIAYCELADNTAYRGAGIYLHAEKASISNCSINNNSIAWNTISYEKSGSGIYISYGKALVDNCQIFNNDTGTGLGSYGTVSHYWYEYYDYGLWDSWFDITLKNTCIYSNIGRDFGSAISLTYQYNNTNNESYFNMINCTIANNRRLVRNPDPYSGAISLIAYNTFDIMHYQILNSIIYNNTHYDDFNNQDLLDNQLCIAWSSGPQNVPADSVYGCNVHWTGYGQLHSSNIDADPLFVSDNDFRLRWTNVEKSPCIMAGYDENFNHLIISSNGTTAFDRKDIGAIQYSEYPHEWIRYGFPTANQNNGIRWMSFPTADRILNNPDNYDMLLTMFEPLVTNNNVSRMQWKPYDFDGSYQEIYYDNNILQNEYLDHEVSPLQGYKFIMDSELQNTVSIISEGVHPTIDTPIPLRALTTEGEPNENWVGYFKKQTVSPFEAFANVIDNLYFIQTQNWTMVRLSTPDLNSTGWVFIGYTNQPQHPITISYGDMAIVKCYENGPLFWPSGGTELEPYEREVTEHYHYIEKPEYKPFFIEFEGTNLPKEVGLYIDDICMGAAKVVEEIVEVPGYLYEGLPEYPDIEFRLYFDERSNDIVPEYLTFDVQSGEFRNELIRINDKQDYYLVKINTNGNNSIPIPKLYISNYPNPFNPSTKIEYYVPEESKVCIDIFDVKGQKVINLVNGKKPKGINQVYWNGKSSNGNNVSSGVYFASFSYKGKQITNKLTLMK